ncbi:hypothetical protein HYE66_00015, partial [Aggregatibacter actinomycetemcomitans]|nr:hypothetical protein [Aggregatibacter actinomycetemcomitans]
QKKLKIPPMCLLHSQNYPLYPLKIPLLTQSLTLALLRLLLNPLMLRRQMRNYLHCSLKSMLEKRMYSHYLLKCLLLLLNFLLLSPSYQPYLRKCWLRSLKIPQQTQNLTLALLRLLPNPLMLTQRRRNCLHCSLKLMLEKRMYSH